MYRTVVAVVGLSLGIGVALFCVLLIQKPYLALLILYALFVKPLVQPYCRLAEILCYLADRQKVLIERYNNEVSVVSNSLIVDHEYVADQVAKTTFDNGYVIYVNFGYKSYRTPSGKNIPERDYRVEKVED